jgi:hypothetical protein
MKKSFAAIGALLLMYLAGILNEAGADTFRSLSSHTSTIPGAMAHWVVAHLPQTQLGKTILHILFRVGVPVVAILFSFKILKEWIYVDRMYILRDLVEAGKLKPADLTPEQHHFIFIHWPDLFKP